MLGYRAHLASSAGPQNDMQSVWVVSSYTLKNNATVKLPLWHLASADFSFSEPRMDFWNAGRDELHTEGHDEEDKLRTTRSKLEETGKNGKV